MVRLARSPPVVAMAVAAGTGAAFLHLGVHLLWTLPPLLLFLLLNRPFRRPGFPLVSLLCSFLGGFLLTQGWGENQGRDCRLLLMEGENLHLTGILVGPLVEGRAEFFPAEEGGVACQKALRLVFPGSWRSRGWSRGDPVAGEVVKVHGKWRKSQPLGHATPFQAGYVRVDSLARKTSSDLPRGISLRRARERFAEIGGWVQTRLDGLFPSMAPLATALVWARKDRLAPEIREAFARAGTAHLLAISGFHVGVVAGGLLLLVGYLGLPHWARFLWASLGVWGYVLAIGIPDAAFRAATLLSILALGRTWTRRVLPTGALATAFLVFLVLDPGALLRPGFQLSFAGALGLVTGYRPMASWIRTRTRGTLPHGLCAGVAAGVSATLATLPLVAWHFGRVSLVGIPMTLLAAPMVAVAIPGIFFCLCLSTVHLPAAIVMASGVETVLQLLSGVVSRAGGLPFASVWVSEPTVVSVAVAVGAWGMVIFFGPRMTRNRRLGLLGFGILSGAFLGNPVAGFLSRGVLEFVVLDVGQGDSALLRSPAGRWVLVDAGPRATGFDAGAREVLPYLRRRGVTRLDMMILTHPDMDHVGGAASVLQEFPVGVVLDPGAAAGTDAYLQALVAARDRGLLWSEAQAGDSMNIDGVAIRVLAPEGSDGSGKEGNNEASLVLEVRFGDFALLLTGDAPAASEGRFLPRILSPRLQVLKVGHHGSGTSTTEKLVKRTGPEAALISVGRRNRFGHPHSGVLSRLEEAGSSVFRTDLHGTISVRAHRDGRYSVSTEFQ